jgi:UDP-N-acetylglucosamine diphosphorylase/glucosamine-1-phosphate N-acetyltransferase
MNKPMAIVMAAGQGTRMKSELPKVLFPVCGRPMVEYVLDALNVSGVDRRVIVVGYRAEDVQKTLADYEGLEFVEQTKQLGTGHAVQVCRENLTGHDGAVVVLTGDSPLVQTSSLKQLLDEFGRTRPACILGTLHKNDAAGLGRIVRDSSGQFTGIVEEKDATDEQRTITEVNMSTYVFDAVELLDALEKLTNDNRQGEYYLTDCPGIMKKEGKDVRALPVLDPCEALSINTIDDLKVVEDEMRRLGVTCAN